MATVALGTFPLYLRTTCNTQNNLTTNHVQLSLASFLLFWEATPSMLYSANTIVTSNNSRGHILSPFSYRNALRRYCLPCVSRSTNTTPPQETSTFKIAFGGCRLDIVPYRRRLLKTAIPSSLRCTCEPPQRYCTERGPKSTSTV